MEWTQKYGIPNAAMRRSTPYTLADSEEQIYNFVSVRLMQKRFKDIQTAVRLWQWIAEKNALAIRDFLTIKSYLFVWKHLDGPLLGWRNCNLPNEWLNDGGKSAQAFGTDDEVTFKGAAFVLAYITNQNLKEYPPIPQIVLDMESKPLMMKSGAPAVSDPLAYIWNVVYQGVFGKNLHDWIYRQCADCGKWEDISRSGRRKTWTRCDDCAKKYRAEKNVEYQRISRERRRKPKK
jgi:hypothetical protein